MKNPLFIALIIILFPSLVFAANYEDLYAMSSTDSGSTETMSGYMEKLYQVSS